jgi:hypothetical protein
MEATQTEEVAVVKKGTQSPVLRAFANLVSYVFHPVFMPVLLMALLYRLAGSSFAGVTPKMYSMKIIAVAVSTLLMPLVVVGLLKALGFLKSFHMDDPKDRIIPLIATMTFYFWIYLVFKNTHEPLIVRAFLLGNFWASMALFLATIFYKVSMHTVAAGGVVGLIIVLMIMSPVSMFYPLIVALVVAGLIGTARLLLGAHTQFEIWAGYLIGIAVQVGAYFYLA